MYIHIYIDMSLCDMYMCMCIYIYITTITHNKHHKYKHIIYKMHGYAFIYTYIYRKDGKVCCTKSERLVLQKHIE